MHRPAALLSLSLSLSLALLSAYVALAKPTNQDAALTQRTVLTDQLVRLSSQTKAATPFSSSYYFPKLSTGWQQKKAVAARKKIRSIFVRQYQHSIFNTPLDGFSWTALGIELFCLANPPKKTQYLVERGLLLSQWDPAVHWLTLRFAGKNWSQLPHQEQQTAISLLTKLSTIARFSEQAKDWSTEPQWQQILKQNTELRQPPL